MTVTPSFTFLLSLVLLMVAEPPSRVLVSAQSGVYPDGLTYNPGYCNICRGDQTLRSPGQTFNMQNGLSWTCGYLQETVQSVNPNADNPTERQACGAAQLQAEVQGCSCNPGASGVLLPPMQSQYIDLHPSCNLCEGVGSTVPYENYDKVVRTTVVGKMNCKGLHDAMLKGIMSANLCPRVQAAAGPTCCLVSSPLVIEVDREPESESISSDSEDDEKYLFGPPSNKKKLYGNKMAIGQLKRLRGRTVALTGVGP